MHQELANLGGLSCQIVDRLPDQTQPGLVVVLCHGFGAPGTDLVPLADELFAIDTKLADAVRFVFPAAPLSLEAQGMPGGRAWWPLDVARFAAAVESGQVRDLRNDLPAGLPEARQMLTHLIDELLQQTGLPMSKVVLGGFSQGSMLATDVTLRVPEPPAALTVFSGTLLCEDKWRPLAEKRGSLPVLQSHGYQDPILPYQGAEGLRDLLRDAGMPVEFLPFSGAHTIPLEALHRFAVMLGDLSA